MSQRQIIDVAQLVDEQKIGSFNLKILALSFLVMLSDGFDFQAASLAGPGVMPTLGVNCSARAPLFSASLLGMLCGGLSFAYVGDRFGRRRAILWSSVLIGAATLTAAFAHSLNELIFLRFVTGIGLGGLPPN